MPRTADDMIKNRLKLSGSEAGRAARYQALRYAMDLKRKSKSGTKATGLQPGDVDVEKQIKRGY